MESVHYYVIRALGTDAEMDYMAKPKYSKKLKKGEMPTGVYLPTQEARVRSLVGELRSCSQKKKRKKKHHKTEAAS